MPNHPPTHESLIHIHFCPKKQFSTAVAYSKTQIAFFRIYLLAIFELNWTELAIKYQLVSIELNWALSLAQLSPSLFSNLQVSYINPWQLFLSYVAGIAIA